jgi:ectoine hydroxylase-related dioxygenase (phytanoyl-CoA dioxygenase family)
VDVGSAKESLRRDGATVLRGVFDREQLGLLSRGVERNLADPGPLCISTTSPDGGRFIEDFCRWQDIPEYERFITASGVGELAAALLPDTDVVRLFHDHLLVKEAATSTPTPLHQDQPYYCIDGRQQVSLWIPLDPVPKASSLELVRGSHASGTWYMPRTFVDKAPMVFDEGALTEVPEHVGDDEILSWALEPGDCVAFDMLTLHRAAGSTGLRRVFSVRCIGDDVTYAPRPHRTSPPFTELSGVVAPGDPLTGDRFPVLYDRRRRSST